MFLPLIAFIAAFTLPPVRDGVKMTVQGLFVPVARPARAIGQALNDAVISPINRFNLEGGPETLERARYENGMLRSRLSNVESQLEDLKKANAQFRRLNTNLQSRVEAATVLGGPVDQRQTLTIATPNLSKIEEKMAVVHPLGVVGRVLSVAPTGGTARVLLATDPAFRVDVRFIRFQTRPDNTIEAVPLPMPVAVLAEGTTRELTVRYLPARPTRELLRVGDAVLLDDPTFPAVTRGLRLGTIRAIDLPSTDAGYASMQIEPTADLATLSEVLVVNK